MLACLLLTGEALQIQQEIRKEHPSIITYLSIDPARELLRTDMAHDDELLDSLLEGYLDLLHQHQSLHAQLGKLFSSVCLGMLTD